MPTYQNNTAAAISRNGQTWAPGETRAVDFFVPDETGLTMTSDAPRVLSPTLASGLMAFADENDPVQRLYVPDCNYFLATIIVKTGSVEIQENYGDNPVRITVSPSAAFRESARRADVEAYHITPLSPSAVEFNISRLTGQG